MTDMPMTQPLSAQNQPFTVLVMLPDYMRGDEDCEADWLRRLWVTAEGPDQALEKAVKEVGLLCGWEDDAPAEAEVSPVAIYSGHIFDLYQP